MPRQARRGRSCLHALPCHHVRDHGPVRGGGVRVYEYRVWARNYHASLSQKGSVASLESHGSQLSNGILLALWVISLVELRTNVLLTTIPYHTIPYRYNAAWATIDR